MNNSLELTALRPTFGIGRMPTCARSRSVGNSVMPSVFLVTSSYGVVRVSSRIFSDSPAFEIHTLRPLMRYVSPSRLANVVMREVSSHEPGSVTPKQTCSVPSTIRGSVRALSSAEPCLTTGCIPKIERWIELAAF
ncbi:MAG: hypothetical protein QOG79_416, partial [Mycobacterium sp.]|nr:hypothetical protein [Mycobacterium sp.]